MDKTKLDKLIRRLKYDYSNLDENSKLAVKIDNELEYLEDLMNGTIHCNYSMSEDCKICRHYERCMLKCRLMGKHLGGRKI